MGKRPTPSAMQGNRGWGQVRRGYGSQLIAQIPVVVATSIEKVCCVFTN
jgi:hypothetical protein